MTSTKADSKTGSATGPARSDGDASPVKPAKASARSAVEHDGMKRITECSLGWTPADRIERAARNAGSMP
jgi:hypothetical protein